MERFQALLEVLLLSGLVSSLIATLLLQPLQSGKAFDLLSNAWAFSLFLLLESAIAFFLLFVIFRIRGERLSGLGLRWHRWKSHTVLGLGMVPVLLLMNGVIALAFRTYLPRYFLEENPLTGLVRTPGQLVLLIFSALIAGGIKEEVQRAFILNRFRFYLGGTWTGLVVWSLAFGLGHYVQGVQGVVIAVLYGFIFGLIYLRSGSLVAPIVAHGVYDSVALVAFWFLSRSPR